MKFTQFLSAILVLFVSATATLCFAQGLSPGEKDTIFIGRLQVQPSVKNMAAKQDREVELDQVAESLETQLISSLTATNVFQVVERRRKGDLELEQAYAAVAVDPNDKKAAQAFKMTGAKFVLLPQIDAFEDITETTVYAAINKKSAKRKLFLSAIVQIIDTSTGELLPDVPSVYLDKVVEDEMVRAGTITASEKDLVELTKEMANKLSQTAIAFLRPAKVLDIMGKEIFINRGREAGFNPGDLVEVYATQNIRDEDSGTTFRKEVPVGQANVARADAKSSYAVVTGDNLGIAKGCLVRVIKSADVAAPKTDQDIPPGSSEKPLEWK